MVVGIKLQKCGPAVKSDGAADYIGLNYINKFPSTGANKRCVCGWGYAVRLSRLDSTTRSPCLPVSWQLNFFGSFSLWGIPRLPNEEYLFYLLAMIDLLLASIDLLLLHSYDVKP